MVDTGALSSAPPPPERWTFVVRFPADKRRTALGALGDIDRTVEIRDARETITTHVSELAVAGEGDAAALVIRPAGGEATGERRLKASDIAAIRTMAPVVIPEGAYLLTEGDYPARAPGERHDRAGVADVRDLQRRRSDTFPSALLNVAHLRYPRG